MADAFWSEQRIHELERDLAADKDVNEDAAWLLERLNDGTGQSKAEKLTTLDAVSGMNTITWEGDDIPTHSRLIGWLHDWREHHGG